MHAIPNQKTGCSAPRYVVGSAVGDQSPTCRRLVAIMPYRFLVADDCSLHVRLLTVALRAAMGADSTTVVQKATAEEALRCCELSKFDCVFVDEDFGSSGMRGSDMIRAVRRRKQDESQSATSGDVPIVSCTSEIDLQLIQAAGATVIWKKPFPPVASIAQTLTDLLTQNTVNK